MTNILEVCCGSYYDALHAYMGKAKRIELNSALFLGGLTPSLATLIKTKEHTNLEVICMVRPRGGGFWYNNEDVMTMLYDAKLLLDYGADGIAFGFLNADKTIDIPSTKKMIRLIHSYNKTAVFHRAIDVCKDMDEAIQTLIALQCDRILTSGGAATAVAGKEQLKNIHNKFGNAIEIVMGSGIRSDNAKQLIDYTQINQVHSSCKGYRTDPTTQHHDVSYQYLDNNNYDIVSFMKVLELEESIQ